MSDLTTKKKFTSDGFKRKLSEVIVNVNENEPFSLADSKHWQELFYYLNPDANVPCRKTICTKIGKTYRFELAELTKFLQALPGKISLKIGYWTSRTGYSFLCTVAQLVTWDWTFNYCKLGLKLLIGTHSDMNLAVNCVLLWAYKLIAEEAYTAYNADVAGSKLEQNHIVTVDMEQIMFTAGLTNSERTITALSCTYGQKLWQAENVAKLPPAFGNTWGQTFNLTTKIEN